LVPPPQPNSSKSPLLSGRLPFLTKPFLNHEPFPSFVPSSHLIPNTCSHTPTTVLNYTSPSSPHFSPTRGGRSGRNS
jgi:hypothetical protein